MCYAEPGPRCKSNFQKSIDSAERKMHKAESLKREMIAVTPEERGVTKNKYETTIRNYDAQIKALRDKISVIEKESDVTKEGLESLKLKLATNDGQDRIKIEARYQEASLKYQAQILAYDREYDTVNLHAPSTFFDSTDMRNLRIERVDVQKKAKTTLRKISDKDKLGLWNNKHERTLEIRKIETFRSRNRKLLEMLEHAEKTESHVLNGYIKDPRTVADWKRIRSNNEALLRASNTRDTPQKTIQSFKASITVAEKNYALAKANYTLEMPTLKTGNGHISSFVLAYNQQNGKWSWINDHNQVFPTEDGFTPKSTRTTINGVVYMVFLKPQPVEVKKFYHPTLGFYHHIVPHQARCHDKVSRIGSPYIEPKKASRAER